MSRLIRPTSLARRLLGDHTHSEKRQIVEEAAKGTRSILSNLFDHPADDKTGP